PARSSVRKCDGHTVKSRAPLRSHRIDTGDGRGARDAKADAGRALEFHRDERVGWRWFGARTACRLACRDLPVWMADHGRDRNHDEDEDEVECGGDMLSVHIG